MNYPVGTNQNGQVNLFAAISPTATGVKQEISQYLKKIFMSAEFDTLMELINEIVGIHSIQKFVSIHTKRSGCSRDNLNVRGR